MNCVQCVFDGTPTVGAVKHYLLPGWGAPVPLCESHKPAEQAEGEES